MKKTLVLLLIGFIIFSMASMDSLAAKKSKKSAGAISQEDMTTMSENLDRLTKKVYSNSLFSPQDNASMIEIKIRLDNQMLIAPDAGLAPLYYKAANLYRTRDYKKEAIDCYQTILENFPDTALAPKARQALKDMGVEIVEPAAESEEGTDADGTTTGQAAPVETTEPDSADTGSI